MTHILILGGISKLHHNINKIGPIFENMLTKEKYTVTITEDMDQILPSDLKNYQIIIDYTTHQKISSTQVQSILTAIRKNSILYMGIHGATTSYADSTEMLKMIGARFIKHPPLRKIKVTVEDIDHPIMK